MKMIGMLDPAFADVLKDLDAVALKHGLRFVGVALPTAEGDTRGVRPVLIDGKPDASLEDLIKQFTGAGVFLIKAAAAVEEYAAAQADKEGA